jgi:signal transduction histidine kinase
VIDDPLELSFTHGDPGLRVVVLNDDGHPRLPTIIGHVAAVVGSLPVVVGPAADLSRVVAVVQAGAVDYLREDPEQTWVAAVERIVREAPVRAMRRNPAALGGRFSELMHTLQHDVKNPINNVLGYVELLSEIPGLKLSDDQMEFLSRIAANCRQMLDILDRFRRQTVELTGID